MSIRENRDKREAWMLLPSCGHLVLAEPTKGKLSPSNRTLEVLLGDFGKANDSCLSCDDSTITNSFTIRRLLLMSSELRKQGYAQVKNLELTKRDRIAAGQEGKSRSLDAQYLEGVVEGAKGKPIDSIISENHFENERGELNKRKNDINYARKAAILAELLPEFMKKLEVLLTELQHDVDCALAFAQGKLLGQRWAEARWEAIPSVEVGPVSKLIQLSCSGQARRCSRATAGLAIARRHRFSRGWGRKKGYQKESRDRYRRRQLVKLVRMAEQSCEENEQVALGVDVV
ncbi:hypothetical protein ONS95_005421 [Cadophora gregata]|uniref:uncharacterized protein n=1 Tax=Cadophora gregata TaxID=51156 RepID=UPI0026DDA6AE|nr:uncharacterized protein ONS95_005421 [Cadophora gregata]KAK0103395.1 hypothetical protein ONS95_005421 [Cadophora gregata]KAK0107585.1 hypothetical protein ONS96_003391 [Cadophora gregata f. sp. sojae]